MNKELMGDILRREFYGINYRCHEIMKRHENWTSMKLIQIEILKFSISASKKYFYYRNKYNISVGEYIRTICVIADSIEEILAKEVYNQK